MENQQKATVGLQPTEPDLLYQKPTNHARRMPMEQNETRTVYHPPHRRHHLQGQGRVQRNGGGDHGGKDSADDPQ